MSRASIVAVLYLIAIPALAAAESTEQVTEKSEQSVVDQDTMQVMSPVPVDDGTQSLVFEFPPPSEECECVCTCQIYELQVVDNPGSCEDLVGQSCTCKRSSSTPWTQYTSCWAF